jgi:hypothetical protein
VNGYHKFRNLKLYIIILGFGSEVTRKIQSCCYNIPNGISPGQVEQIVTITRINLVFADAATIKGASAGYLSVKGDDGEVGFRWKV